MNRIKPGHVLVFSTFSENNPLGEVYVIERTQKFALIKRGSKTKLVKIYTDEDGEHILPYGRYSLSPTARAPKNGYFHCRKCGAEVKEGLTSCVKCGSNETGNHC